jgi:hypothetical protein
MLRFLYDEDRGKVNGKVVLGALPLRDNAQVCRSEKMDKEHVERGPYSNASFVAPLKPPAGIDSNMATICEGQGILEGE